MENNNNVNGISNADGIEDVEQYRKFIKDKKQQFIERVKFWCSLFSSLILYGFVIFIKNIYEIFVPKPEKDIRGQLALITGGANGIGRETALNLAAKGCNIAIADIDLEKGKKTAEELKSLGVKAKAFKTDVAKLEEIELLKEDIEQSLGTVDILINNAGIFYTKNVTEEKPENVERMMNINLMSHFWTVRVFLPGMIERKRGHVIGISSLAGVHAFPESIVYTTSKMGVRGFMEALSIQLHFEGNDQYVKTTTVFPYFIDSNPYIANVILGGSKQKVIHSVDRVGKDIVKGLLQDRDIVAIPNEIYYGMYLVNAPISLKKHINEAIMKKGYKPKPQKFKFW